ncbi:sulfotransferase [Methylohalobius crimeensis]|uniref:sulfotransferase n=1 Tax=Methylohalobius crimeensis TaxID=244365 RepID=UPI0003B4D83B|nr:sulfotransferase [Methylohalobius crimeensis]
MKSADFISKIYERYDRWLLLARKPIFQWIQRMDQQQARVLFVAGVQRSGTNMLMDVLERSLQTEVFHERDPRAFVNYHLRDIPHIQELVKRSRAEVVVLKCLMESQKLRDLLATFPQSRGVWMFRHYNDVVNSMIKSFRNQAAQVKRIARDKNSDGWLGEQMSDETHNLVVRLTRSELDDANAAAIQWYFRNIRFFEQDFADDQRVELVHYDTLVKRPEEEVQRLFTAHHLKFSKSITKFINSRSICLHNAPTLRQDVTDICDQLYTRLLGAYKAQSF